MAQKDDAKPRISFWQLMLLVTVGWFVIGACLPVLLERCFPALVESTQKTGVLGDTFGTVNALFSGLALAAVAYSIFLQRAELGYQRKELRLQRKELRLQREEVERNRLELARTARAQETTQELMAISSQMNALMALNDVCPEGLRVKHVTVPLVANRERFVNRLIHLLNRITSLDVDDDQAEANDTQPSAVEQTSVATTESQP